MRGVWGGDTAQALFEAAVLLVGVFGEGEADERGEVQGCGVRDGEGCFGGG